MPCGGRAAAWPLVTAPSIVAGRPVSIQSPARNNPGTAVSVAAAAAARRHRERRAPLAHDEAVPQHRRARRGSASRTAANARPRRARRSSRRPRRRRRWPPATGGLAIARARRPRRRPTARAVPAAQGTGRHDAAVEPEVRRDDRRRRRGGRRLHTSTERRPVRSETQPSRACHATAAMTARAPPVPSTVDGCAMLAVDDQPSRAGVRTCPPRSSRNARAGWRTARPAATTGNAIEAPRRPAKHPAEHLDERRRGGHVDRLVQRGQRQRLPQQLDEPGVCPWRTSQPRLFPADAASRERPGAERIADPASEGRPTATVRRAGAAATAAAGHARRDERPAPSTMSIDRRCWIATFDAAPMRRRKASVSS